MAVNIVEIVVRAKNMTQAGMAEAEASTSSLGATIKKIGAAGTLALAGIGYESVKMAMSFQQASTLLQTQAGVTGAKLATLKSGILSLAGQVGFSPDSLAQAAYHVASNMQSMGATAGQMLNAVRVAAEGAKVGQANLVDVTNALGAAIASGISGVKNYNQAMGVLNATVGTGDMKMQDLADAFGTGLLATVKGFGVTLKDVGAALATFGDNNIRGAQAGTELRMAVEALAAPAKTGQAALAQLGLSATQLGHDMQRGGLDSAVIDLKKHLDAAGVSASQQGQILTEVFGKKAGVGINVLISQFARLQSKYPDLVKGANSFGSAWATQSQTFKQKMDDLRASVDTLMISIGNRLIPILSSMAGFLLRNRDVVVPLVGALAAFIGVMMTLAGVIKVVEIATKAWAGIQAILDAELLANPVGLVIAAIAALVVGVIYAYNHFKAFRDVVQAVFAAVRAIIGAAVAWIRQQLAVLTAFWHQHAQEIRQVWSAIYRVIKLYWTLTVDEIKVGLAVLKAVWTLAWGLLRDTVRLVWSVISKEIHAAIQLITGVIGIGLDLITGHWSKAGRDLRNLTSQMFHDVVNIIKSIVSGFGTLLFDAGRNLVQGLINGITSMIGAAGNAIKSVVSTIRSFLPFSPAKQGPLSGSGSPDLAGRKITQMLAGGMLSGLSSVSGAAGRAAGAVAAGTAGAAGSPGMAVAGRPLQLDLVLHVGNADVRDFLQKVIRVGGGSPELMVRKVRFA